MGTRSAESEIKISFQSTIKNTLDDGDITSASLSATVISGKLNNGVSASQANRAWKTVGESLSSGASIDIDLYDFASFDIGAGNGVDALGQAMAIEEIVTLMIKQSSGSTGRLEINVTNPTGKATWIPSLTVANGAALKNGGIFIMHQPDTDAFDIQDGVSHTVRLTANGGDVEWDMWILARHDDDETSSSTSSSLSSSSSSSQSSSSSSLSSSSSSSTT